jgi:hypothetical protein
MSRPDVRTPPPATTCPTCGTRAAVIVCSTCKTVRPFARWLFERRDGAVLTGAFAALLVERLFT